MDTTGNESAPTVVGPLVLVNMPPQPPTGVAVSFGADGTNFLSWALSEDDGYNDRDVARYDIYQAILLGGAFVKIGEAPAGVGVYGETNVPVAAGSYLRYAVVAVDTNGQASAQVLANRFLSGGNGVDNDGDGMADDWELAHALNPQDPTDGAGDADHDGVSNVEEFLRGSDPAVFDNLRFGPVQRLTNGVFQLTVNGEVGRNYSIMVSTNLANWTLLTNFVCTNATMLLLDASATNSGQRFYRLGAFSAYAAGVQLILRAVQAPQGAGVDVVLNGTAGVTYRVDVSTNLSNWLPLANVVSTNAVTAFRDSAATNFTQRFYRAVIP